MASRLTTNQEIAGSTPAVVIIFLLFLNLDQSYSSFELSRTSACSQITKPVESNTSTINTAFLPLRFKFFTPTSLGCRNLKDRSELAKRHCRQILRSPRPQIVCQCTGVATSHPKLHCVLPTLPLNHAHIPTLFSAHLSPTRRSRILP